MVPNQLKQLLPQNLPRLTPACIPSKFTALVFSAFQLILVIKENCSSATKAKTFLPTAKKKKKMTAETAFKVHLE